MSIGAEIKASIIDINANNYMKVTDMKLINDTKEQVLSGFDFNVSTQLPYSPWAILTYREYEYKTEKSNSDIEGEEYSLGLDINPTLVLDLKVDNSKNQSTDNVYSAKINFVYPPKENKKTYLVFYTNIEETIILSKTNPFRIAFNDYTQEPSPYILVRKDIEAKIDRKSFYRLLDLAEYSKLEGKEWLGIYSDSIFFPIILRERLDKELI